MAAKATMTKFNWKEHAEQILEAIDYTLTQMTEREDKNHRPFLYGQSIRNGFRIQIFIVPLSSPNTNPNKISLK